MNEKPLRRNHSHWRLPLYSSIVGLIVLFAIAVSQADIALFLNVFFVAPVLVVFSIALPLFAVIRVQRQLLPALAGVLALWAIALSLFFYNREHPFALPETNPRLKMEISSISNGMGLDLLASPIIPRILSSIRTTRFLRRRRIICHSK
jgi:hypothetical protein